MVKNGLTWNISIYSIMVLLHGLETLRKSREYDCDMFCNIKYVTLLHHSHHLRFKIDIFVQKVMFYFKNWGGWLATLRLADQIETGNAKWLWTPKFGASNVSVSQCYLSHRGLIPALCDLSRSSHLSAVLPRHLIYFKGFPWLRSCEMISLGPFFRD